MGDVNAWRQRLSGYDPYDALLSPRVPKALRATRGGRQATIQLRRRMPLNLAPLLGIRPFVMAKTVACQLMAVSRRPASAERDSDLRALVTLLQETGGSLGGGRWGYEFDVQTRWAFYPAGSPNLIVTAFAARALLEASAATGNGDWLELGMASARWIARELVDPGGGFIRYVPDSHRLIHNANLLGAGCLAAAGVLSGDRNLLEAGSGAAGVSIAAQLESGGWPYGEGRGLGWEDNFHTAYDLDGLLTLSLAAGGERVAEALALGSRYWSTRFFGAAGEPWFGPRDAFPLDIHSAGTAIDVGARLARHGLCSPHLVEKVAEWTRERLVHPTTGRTFARQGRLMRDRRTFVRWGDAHYAMGLASLNLLQGEGRYPFEESIAAWRSRFESELRS